MKSLILAALLCSTALTAPKPAQAGPVLAAVSASLATSLGFAAGTLGFTLVSTAVSLGASMALSALGQALSGNSGTPDLIRQAQIPTSLPLKRSIYGAPRIYGAPAWRVQGNILYAAMIMNSRPSEAITGLWLDKRECTLTGDMYNLAGAGAVASAAPFAGYVTVWAGLGGQTAAPLTITTEASSLFLPTDAGEGMTILWLRLDAGPASTRAERWPAFPPEVEVDGQWSKVWDMRDVAQDQDDPTTWEWSANQALCALDAARTNPIRPYPLDQIMQDLFEEAADIADEAVALDAGGTEPRYEVNGGLLWNGSELMDQMMPLFTAGASDPVRVGGKLGIIPGAYTSPVMTLTDITEAEGLDFQSLKPGRDLATTVRCTFTDPARDWRTSELEDYTVPGAQAADGGTIKSAELALPMVTSPTQAMRIQKIAAHRQRSQRAITCTLPPSAFKLIAGANVTVDFPAPYEVLNGTYRVARANPGLSASEEAGGGVAMRVPVVLEEIASTDFAWTAATDEQARELLAYDGTVPVIADPGAITTTTGASVAIQTGNSYSAAIRFAFDPSTSASVVTYEWQWKLASGPWSPGGLIDADIRDGSDKVFGYLAPAALGGSYTIRARSIGAAASDWVESSPVVATVGVARYEADYENATYEIDGVTATRGNVLSLTRPDAGTYVDASGDIQTAAADVVRIDHLLGAGALLIEPAATNLLTRSGDISHADWAKAALSASASAGAGIVSGTTAQTLVENAATSSHYLRQAKTIASGAAHTIFAIAKAGSGAARFLGLSLYSVAAPSSWVAARFDLATGAVASTNASGAGYALSSTGARIYPLGSGYYLCALSGVISTATDLGAIVGLASSGTTYAGGGAGMQSYTGDGNSHIILNGVQLEAGIEMTSFIQTTAAAVTRAADVPTMQGVTGTMDLLATYGDGTDAAFDASPVIPGFWPALTKTRLSSLIGTI